MKLLSLKKPNCMPCGMVERHLNGKLEGIHTETYDVSTDEGISIASLYGAMSVPLLIAIDRQGIIVERVQGYKPDEVDELLTKF